MQKLNNITKKLNDPNETLYFVSVRNAGNKAFIEQLTGATLRQHGNIEKYLHTLHGKGIKEVILEPRKRNGSSSKPCGQPVTLKLDNSSVAVNSHTSTPAQPQSAPAAVHYPEPQIPGLMGVGLGQYMEAHSSMRALTKLEQDHAELKMKYETLLSEKEKLKDDNAELKRTNERLEDKCDRKGPLDGIDIKETLPAILAILRPQPQNPGLNAPAQKELSPIKEATRQTVESDGFPDEIIEKCYITLQHYATGNEKFVKNFEALINENNLKKVNNNG